MMQRILKITFIVFVFSTLVRGEVGDTYSADAYFNLGNKAYNNGQYGEAVYNYEKALILEPKAKDIIVNLQLAVERLDADIIELEPFFLAKWWTGISNTFLPGTWKLISLLFLVGLLGVVFLFFFKGKSEDRSFYILGAVFLLMILMATLAGKSRSGVIFDNKFAIVSGNADSIYQGPDLVSEKIKPVVDGVKVKILDANSEWYKVSTMDSEQGWIRKENVRLLKFNSEEL